MSLLTLPPGEESIRKIVTVIRQTIKYVQGLSQAFVTNVATAGLATGGPITATGTVTVTAATKADQQTASSNVVAVTPLHQQDHDSAAKAWAQFSVAATVVTINKSYNVTSIVRNATGDFTITFTTSFDSANYTFVGASRDSLANAGHMSGPFTTAPTASAIRVVTVNFAGTLVDPAYASAVFFGRQ